MTSLVLDTLSITNFKSFTGEHEFKLSRPAGLYYIAGRNRSAERLTTNGVGKTTLFDALMWVLFNKTCRDNNPASAVVPWTLSKGTCSVALRFFRGREEYKLTRSRRPNELQLRSYNPNTVRTIPQEEIPKLIGINEETFRRTVVLGQFGTMFLDLGPEQQSRMFNDSLGLDLWLRASKLASLARDNHNEAARQARESLVSLQGRQSEATDRLASEERLAKAHNAEHYNKVKTAEAELKKRREALREILAEARNDGQGKGSSRGLGLGALESELAAQRDALAGGEKALRQLNGAIGKGEAALSSARNTVSRYQKAIEKDKVCPECGQKVSNTHLLGKLEAAKAEAQKCKQEMVTLEEQHGKLTTLIRLTTNKASALQQVFQKAQSAGSVIMVLEKQLEELADTSNPHINTAHEIRKRMAGLQIRIDTQTESIAKFEKQAGECAYWVDAFREIRLGLIDRTLAELEAAADQHVEALGLDGWNIKFQTERESKSGNVSAVFTTLLYPPEAGGDPIRWQSYSGGESQRWQMAVAFALSEVLLERSGIEVNVEVYDEPTKGLSERGVEELLERLQERARELNRAIYVVEHHSLERGMFSDTIVVEKTKRGSQIL